MVSSFGPGAGRQLGREGLLVLLCPTGRRLAGNPPGFGPWAWPWVLGPGCWAWPSRQCWGQGVCWAAPCACVVGTGQTALLRAGPGQPTCPPGRPSGTSRLSRPSALGPAVGRGETPDGPSWPCVRGLRRGLCPSGGRGPTPKLVRLPGRGAAGCCPAGPSAGAGKPSRVLVSLGSHDWLPAAVRLHRGCGWVWGLVPGGQPLFLPALGLQGGGGFCPESSSATFGWPGEAFTAVAGGLVRPLPSPLGVSPSLPLPQGCGLEL